MAYSVVVNAHDGELSLDSEMGVGTTFVVRLPVDGRRPAGPDPLDGP